MGRTLLSALASVLLLASPVLAQEKGGEDETGSYEVVANWPQPWSPAGYIWGSQPAVFAQSPDRIFIGVRGEIKAPTPAPRGFNGSWGSTGQRATEPPAETRNCLVVVNRSGHVIESWTQWDKLFEGGGSPHKIRISPYDPDKHVWVVNDGKHVIHKFTNDGKKLVMTIGEAGVPGDDATHFGSPQDLGFLPDGSILVADGLRNARIAKFDKDGKFVKSWGKRGTGPGEFANVLSIAVDAQGNVYAGDGGNKRIQVFDNNGVFKTAFSNFGNAQAMCITRGANPILYVSNSNPWNDIDVAGEIYRMRLDGTALGKFGRAGRLLKEFGAVNSIDCRGENTLFVGELANLRVQKLVLH